MDSLLYGSAIMHQHGARARHHHATIGGESQEAREARREDQYACMEKLGISDELPQNARRHSPTTCTGGALPMRLKLQLVLCDDGHEATVTDVVTLQTDHRR